MPREGIQGVVGFVISTMPDPSLYWKAPAKATAKPASADSKATTRAAFLFWAGNKIRTATPMNDIYIVQASISGSELRHHLHDRGVNKLQNELRINPEHKNQCDYWQNNQALSQIQVGEAGPL